MGMDFYTVCSVSWLREVSFLSRVFSRLFRWQTLRHQRRIGANGSMYAASHISQLVPISLSIRLCRFPLREPRNLRSEACSSTPSLPTLITNSHLTYVTASPVQGKKNCLRSIFTM